MNAKNLFIALFITFSAATTVAILFYHNPAGEQLREVKKELQRNTARFNNASHANRDIENVRLKYEQSLKSLQDVEKRFIYRRGLGEITTRLKQHAKSFNLELIDFTPIFKVYFSDTSSSRVKKLPFTLTVSGSYLDVGHFIESWPEMEFFITPGQLYLGKKGIKSNLVEADITGLLYAWDDTGGAHDAR